MVNFTKTDNQQARNDLAVEKEKRVRNLAKNPKSEAGTYRLPIVIEQIKEDFKGKCYLCEDKNLKSINIEHFRPHEGNPDIEFDFDNLFWSCSHCNNSKLAGFQNILDCTNPAHKVAEWILYKIENIAHQTPNNKILVAVNNGSFPDEYAAIVEETVRLLNKIYIGESVLKTEEAKNFRKDINDAVGKFRQELINFYQEKKKPNCTPADTFIFEEAIRRHLSIDSPFTAFKRWFVLDNPKLREDFEKYFD